MQHTEPPAVPSCGTRLRDVLVACERHGIVPGIHADEVLAPRWIERGFRLITVGYDQFAAISGLGSALEVSRGEPLDGPRQPFTGYR